MAILTIPERQTRMQAPEAIRAFLAARGIRFDQWRADCILEREATQDAVLAAYRHALEPYMAVGGYQTADVISVHADTPDLPAIREKFLREHTHSEDEVRFFVEGRGHFWFHLEPGPKTDEEVFCVTCEAGDLLAVPAGYRHWFDLGDEPQVTVIRIFTDAAGWVPHYTHSGIDARYQLKTNPA